MGMYPKSVQEITNANAPASVKAAINALVAAIDEPNPKLIINDGQLVKDAAGSPLSVTIQVVNYAGVPIRHQFPVKVWISTTATGYPGGTQTVGAPSEGGVFETVSANQSFEFITNKDGELVFTVTAASAGLRYVRATSNGPVFTGALQWT